MIALHSCFPELAARETRCLHVLTPDGPLPPGEYGFLEHYCEQPDCDCRRVLLRVTSAKSPHTVLATINCGWESAGFYTRWMHGDEQAGREITAASLDPLHPQSKYADYLLDFVQKELITDPAYVARLARHYDLFKQALRNRPPTEPPATLSTPAPQMTIPEILQQLQHVPDRCEFAAYETVNEFVRGQVIDGLLVQCIWGERPREAVIADLRGLFSTLAKPGDCYLWAQLVSAVNDFNALELLPEVRRAFAENLVDDTIIGLDDIDPDVKREPRGYKPPTREVRYDWFCERNAPIDAVNECSGWLCFRDENEDTGPWDDDEGIDQEARPDDAFGLPPGELPHIPAPTPYLAPPKIGRNDPCPCGSGKKYKKCCGK
ncbi:MAG: DUF1186 domain-containing protein [Verrucomicrobiae bacterium]|nr:DUF1186 domain-containing protein [Verrucomicrobiae bacterium]